MECHVLNFYFIIPHLEPRTLNSHPENPSTLLLAPKGG